jgi:signal transduction histidine kinase
MNKLLDTGKRYPLAGLIAMIALVVRMMLTPLLGYENPFHTVWAAVVFSAWYCGLGPSILTTLICALGVWYWFLLPSGSFALQDARSGIAGLAGFLILSGFIIALGESNRRAKTKFATELERREALERDLRLAHAQLEDRVRARTAELDAANQGLRRLSSSLLQLQDEERRRLSRELHDSIGQILAAIKMNIAMVRSTPLDPAAQKAAADNDSLIDQVTTEIRTISHLLHPPLLDEIGLASALRWYVDGFSERSKIAVTLQLDNSIGRLPAESEIALFRIVQECLTNIHRHSGSRIAVVRLTKQGRECFLEIEDKGVGIPKAKQAHLSSFAEMGVGFRGMNERMAQLGGGLEVRSDSKGTSVIARLPMSANAEALPQLAER